MGMHFGFLAVEAPQQVLEQALAGINARLTNFGPQTTLADLEESGKHEDPTAVQSHGHFTLLYDSHMLLTHDVDLVVELSRLSGKRACATIGETVSGTYFFAYANAGKLIRAYWHCHAAQSHAWETGTPLKVEQKHAFDDDLDGGTFVEALIEIGIGDLKPVFDNARWKPCTPDFDFEAKRTIPREFSDRIKEFSTQHALAEPPPIEWVMREPPELKPSLGERIKKLFGL